MANSPSALKRARKSLVNRDCNRAIRNKVKSSRKKVFSVAESGGEVAKSLSAFYSSVDKAVKKKVLHSNKGSNLKRKTVARIVKFLEKDSS